MKSLKLVNQKTVRFSLGSFCCRTKKTRDKKHTIYAACNKGFTATEHNLKSGYAVKRLGLTVKGGLDGFVYRLINEIDGTVIKRIFCFSTVQSGQTANVVIAITETDIYYIPLLASMTPRSFLDPNIVTGFDCFAYSHSKGVDYIFAGSDNGVFAADHSLDFQPLPVNFLAKQMHVFNNRLFVLDRDQATVHFSAALDLCDFGAGSGLAGSIKIDDTLGKILSLETYNGKLLLVHEYGFRTLQTAYNPAKFRLATLVHSFEAIIPNSAKALGDTIYFLTHGGLCKYQRKVELLDISVDSGEDTQSIVYDNKYFLSTGGKMFVIDKFSDSVTVYENMNVTAFERVWNEFSDSLAVLTENGTFIYQIAKPNDNAEQMVWESDWFSLGYATTKQYVRRVLIKTATEIDLVISSTRGRQTIKVWPGSEIQTINLNFKGDAFKVGIIAEGADVDISSLSVTVGF